VTDLVHVNGPSMSTLVSTAHQWYGEVMRYQFVNNAREYVFFLHLAFSILLGIFAGVHSLLITERIIQKTGLRKLWTHTVLVLILLASSIGIYIGRFLRFFSWEIIFPLRLIKELLAEMNAAFFGFIAAFTIFQVVCYYTYRALIIQKK